MLRSAAFLLLLSSAVALAQPLPDYYSRSNFLLAPPAGYAGGLAGFSNPANLAFLTAPELKLFWSNDRKSPFRIENWGAFAGSHSLGLAVQRQKVGGISVKDYKLSMAGGSRALAMGIGYGWSTGSANASRREKHLTLGAIFRPSKYFSTGFIANQSVQSAQREGVSELGIRPLGNSRLTLFADAALQKGVRFKDAQWSVGGAAELFPGVTVLTRYFDTKRFTVGLSFNFGKKSVGAQAHYDRDTNYTGTTYFSRFGAHERGSVTERFDKSKYYVPLTLKGRVSYLKYKYLDTDSPRLLEILRNIQAAIADPRVQALALNLSAMQVRPEHAWEIREALKQAKAAGKKVIIFIDNVGMTGYHLASVADQVICDRQGSVMLDGYALGRTYVKGTLKKLGLGFDAWRFFKYKSAVESLSRDSMSEADREQLQAYVDDWYELTRSDVCTARKISPEQFDKFVDEEVFFMADHALAAGLVDTLARWSDIDGIIAKATGKPAVGLSVSNLFENAGAIKDWGSRDKIAIVYALGVCEMDSGIRARWLEKVFDTLTENSSIKAVVFRVDSPGGDAMASDFVAQAVKSCAEIKPVIISQGQVAASGGYWVSIYGSKIVAGPNTVTGSIGVIGGWLYDAGFGDKLGMTADLVQRGQHADMGKGVRLPFTPLEIPARNVTPEEREKIKTYILKYYDQFVKLVADGRGLDEARVREIAQGRIYSGIDGKETGLVDEIGGLLSAIAIARKEAGILPDEKIDLVELPMTKGWFNLSEQLLPVKAEVKQETQFLKQLLQLNGRPAPFLLPGAYPEYEK